MNLKSLCVALAGLAVVLPVGAIAVEAPKPVIVLFNNNIQVFLAGTDISTSAGIEAIGATELITSNIATANPDKVKSRVKFNLKVRRPVNNADRGSYAWYVNTRNYPNPHTTEGNSYYCEEENGDVVYVDIYSEGFPCSFYVNFGIANSGQTRYFVAGLATYAWYENQQSGTVNIGQASVSVFDPANQSLLWRNTWKDESGDWELEDNLSAVGDFLHNDGVDEVRIVYSRGLANNAAEMRYTYYDIASGNQLVEQTFTVAGP